MAKKALSSQDLVNTFPAWSNVRGDEQSLGYQFINNTVAHHLDDIRKQLRVANDNYYIGSSNVSDIDLYHFIRLPGNFEFVKEDDDPTELIFTPPTTSGVIGDNSYEITIAEDNSIEGFWYNAKPDRISSDLVASGEYLVASGFSTSSPLGILLPSGLLTIPNYLYITVSGGTTFFDVTDDNFIRRAIVQVPGITRQGQELTEDLIFIQDETQRTQHEFREVGDIKVYGIEEAAETFVTVSSMQFNQPDYPFFYQEINRNFEKEDQSLFWGLAPGPEPDQYTLDVIKYDTDDLTLRLQGFAGKHALFSMELLDSGMGRINPSDLAVEPYSDRIWVVDSGVLYCYDTDLPYPDASKLDGKDYDAGSVIESNSYYVVLGEPFELDYVWRRPVESFVKHRVSVQKPDGSKFSIEDGVEVTFNTDPNSWIFGEPRSRTIRPSNIFVPDQRGEYVYTLEVEYGNGTTSTDRRIISVVSKTAQAQFNLAPAIGNSNEIIGIDFDSEHNMWVLDNTGTMYKINRHYDNMLIDFNKKIMYFREPYDQVRVI